MCCASSNQHVCSLCACCSWLMVNLAYLAHSDDLMRKAYGCTMHPPCAKIFAGPRAYFYKIAFFAARCFPNCLFYKTAPFAASEALYTNSSKSFGLWRLRPQSRTADARNCGSRQNSQRFTLRFSGVQILFQVLLYSELEPQRRFFLKFISSAIQCRFHFAFSKIGFCICYVRLP